MKTLLTLIIIFIGITVYAQSDQSEIVKLKDGTEIKINLSNKTWEYYSDKTNINVTVDTIKSKFFVKKNSLVGQELLKKPCSSSPIIKESFLNNGVDIELIGYVNGYFKVKNNEGKVGYVFDTYFSSLTYDELMELKKIKVKLQEKDVISAKKNGQKILINGADVSDVNSADGVDIKIECGYFDKSKDIKYLYFTVIPYNSVGDLQTCDISGHTEFTCQVTGPISGDDEIHDYYWESAWYNSTISCLKITKVKVVYIDGSSKTYINDLPKIMNPEYKYGCNL